MGLRATIPVTYLAACQMNDQGMTDGRLLSASRLCEDSGSALYFLMPELRRLDILFFEIGGNNTKGCEELPCFVTSAARSLCLSQTLAAQLTTVPFRLL